MHPSRAIPLLIAALAASPALGSSREAYAATTVTGPLTLVDHQTAPDGAIAAHVLLSAGIAAGPNASGETNAEAAYKRVRASASGVLADGGGISYNSAYAVSVDHLQLFSQQLQPDEVATVTFSVSFDGDLAGSASGTDLYWFDADVVGGVVLGDVNDGVYGTIDSFPDTPDFPAQNGAIVYTTTWRNSMIQDLTLSVSADADCAARSGIDTAFSSSNYFHTVRWMGIARVVNTAGIEITDYSIVDEYGNDWRTPALPDGACSADFNGDGDLGTDADIADYFRCLSGDCCATCGSADFNGDGDIGTDADIASFFRVLAGGAC